MTAPAVGVPEAARGPRLQVPSHGHWQHDSEVHPVPVSGHVLELEFSESLAVGHESQWGGTLTESRTLIFRVAGPGHESQCQRCPGRDSESPRRSGARQPMDSDGGCGAVTVPQSQFGSRARAFPTLLLSMDHWQNLKCSRLAGDSPLN